MSPSRWPRRFAGLALVLLGLGTATFFWAPYLASYSSSAVEKVRIGDQVPELAAVGEDGVLHNLLDYRGKIIVLEWMSPICEFTAKHYDSGHMQALQQSAAADGVIWLSVNSNAKDASGHLSVSEALKRIGVTMSAPAHLLIDDSGVIGKTFGAKSTPSIAIIDQAGILRYKGAIDDQPWGNGDPAKSQNYVTRAVGALRGGQPVKTATTISYGCSIKY
jgi:peroxiredoxin